MSASSPEALAAAFGAAVNAGDVPAALELWIDDPAIVQADGQLLRGRDAIATALHALVDHGASVNIEVSRVLSAGETAIATGKLTISGKDADGAPFTQHSQSVVVYSRGADDRWRIAIDAPWGLPSA
jgi:uncharacterized protein (TIGR02246 family)